MVQKRKQTENHKGLIVRVKCPLCGMPIHQGRFVGAMAKQLANDSFMLCQEVVGRGRGIGAIGKQKILRTYAEVAGLIRAGKDNFPEKRFLDMFRSKLTHLVLKWLGYGLLDNAIIAKAKISDVYEKLESLPVRVKTVLPFATARPAAVGLGIQPLNLDSILYASKAKPSTGLGIERISSNG